MQTSYHKCMMECILMFIIGFLFIVKIILQYYICQYFPSLWTDFEDNILVIFVPLNLMFNFINVISHIVIERKHKTSRNVEHISKKINIEHSYKHKNVFFGFNNPAKHLRVVLLHLYIVLHVLDASNKVPRKKTDFHTLFYISHTIHIHNK